MLVLIVVTLAWQEECLDLSKKAKQVLSNEGSRVECKSRTVDDAFSEPDLHGCYNEPLLPMLSG
jgi:hypothetical protein